MKIFKRKRKIVITEIEDGKCHVDVTGEFTYLKICERLLSALLQTIRIASNNSKTQFEVIKQITIKQIELLELEEGAKWEDEKR